MRTCPECQNHYEDEILHCPEDGFNLTGIEPVDEMIGRTIGSYKVTKPLGKGGMGAVYAGVHPVIGSRVAIKFLHPQYATDAKIVDRFFNEARAVNIIGHDNVLKILDLNVTDDNRHYFVMEYLHGKALQALIKPNVPMTLEDAGPILVQICLALQSAHDKGIIHRDMKPDNVYLITLNGRKNFVKVVDFGIAKLTDDAGNSTGKTQTGMVMGTPAYMSPEQGSGETSKIDARSDVYSLGAMMYQMATGKLPFPGSNFGEVLMGHLQKKPVPPRQVVPGIPEEYEAIILKTLEKRQEDRYQSMSELREAIFGVMQAKGINAELPLADATEEMEPIRVGSASNPGLRTPSKPGGRGTNPPTGGKGAPRSSLPPKMASQAPKQPTKSGAGRSQSGSTRPPVEPKKSNTGMIIGIVAAVVVVGGGAVGLQMKSAADKKDAEEKSRVLAEKTRKAKELAAVVEQMTVSVVSEPQGAEADVTWPDGAKSAATPFTLQIPKGAKVHFEFKKDGFVSQVMDTVADQPLVNVVLKAVSKPQPPPAEKPVAANDEKGSDEKVKKGPKKPPKKEDVPAQKDGLIDLGDAFK